MLWTVDRSLAFQMSDARFTSGTRASLLRPHPIFDVIVDNKIQFLRRSRNLGMARPSCLGLAEIVVQDRAGAVCDFPAIGYSKYLGF